MDDYVGSVVPGSQWAARKSRRVPQPWMCLWVLVPVPNRFVCVDSGRAGVAARAERLCAAGASGEKFSVRVCRLTSCFCGWSSALNRSVGP